MSYRKNKLTYRVFFSHSSDYPQDDLDKIKAVCTELSTSESSADFEFQDMYSGRSSDAKTKESLLNDAKRSDVFFRLLHEVYGGGTKDEYDTKNAYEKAKKKLGRDSIYTFIRTDSVKSRNLFAELKKESGTIIDYSDLDYFKKRVKDELIKYRDARKKNRWLQRIIIAAFVLFSLLYIFSGDINKLLHRTPRPDPVVPAEIENKSRYSFNERIANAEGLLHQKEYAKARDSLIVLKGICSPKWTDLEARIDSLLQIIPPLPRTNPKPSEDDDHNIQKREGDPNDIARPTISSTAFRVCADPIGLAVGISSSIEENTSFKEYSEGENPRWVITVTEDKSAEEVFEKIVANDFDQVNRRFIVSIADATGKLPGKKKVIDTFGESPNGIASARTNASDAAVKIITEFFADYVK